MPDVALEVRFHVRSVKVLEWHVAHLALQNTTQHRTAEGLSEISAIRNSLWNFNHVTEFRTAVKGPE